MDRNATRCAASLREVLSEDRVNEIARETGFCKRLRKLTPVRAVWTFLVGLGSGTSDTLADFVRLFADLTGEEIEYKPFHDRISQAAFPRFLRALCGEMMSGWIRPMLLCKDGALARFDDIWIQDGSSFALNDRLAEHFPGRFKKGSPAAAEVHCTYSLFSTQAVRLGVAGDTQPERDFLPAPVDVSGKLLLLDRGYICHAYFQDLDREGAHYICRAKEKHANPRVLECLEGLSIELLEKTKLKDLDLPDQTVDLIVETKVRPKQLHRHRLVFYWVERVQKHVVLYTNLPAEDFPAETVATAYRLRWQVELFFKECKSYTKLKKFQTADPHIAEGLIWGSMLAVLLRRHLSHSANEAKGIRSAPFVAAAVSWMFLRELGTSAVHEFRKLKQVIVQVLSTLRRVARRTNAKRRTPFEDLAIGAIPMGS